MFDKLKEKMKERKEKKIAEQKAKEERIRAAQQAIFDKYEQELQEEIDRLSLLDDQAFREEIFRDYAKLEQMYDFLRSVLKDANEEIRDLECRVRNLESDITEIKFRD